MKMTTNLRAQALSVRLRESGLFTVFPTDFSRQTTVMFKNRAIKLFKHHSIVSLNKNRPPSEWRRRFIQTGKHKQTINL